MLLSLAGMLFPACASTGKEQNQNKDVCMYGCPYADYDIKGKVVNKRNKGVENILVEIGRVQNSKNGRDFVPYTAVMTDADGNYHFEGSDQPADVIRIRVSDIDGKENGGRFESDSVTLNLEFKDKDKGNGFYYGKSETTVPDIKLKKK